MRKGPPDEGAVAGAAGVAAAAALAPWVVLPGAGDAFELPKRLVFAGLGAWLAWRAWRRPGRTAGTDGLWTAWWLLAAWMAARSFLGAEWGRWAAPWLAWTLPPAMFALALANRWTTREKRGVARAVAVSGILQAALMLPQRWGFDPLWGAATAGMEYAPGRMVGTVGYQNQAAEFLALAAVCAAFGWKGWRRWAFCAPPAAMAAATANRGAIAGMAAACAAMVAFRRMGAGPRRRDRRAALAAAVAAGAVLLALATGPETRARLAELARPGRSPAVRSRLWMAKVAVAMWRDHVWTGAGGGAYGREYVDRLGEILPDRLEAGHVQSVVHAREAHCDVLQFGAEFGAVGLLLAGWLAWAAGCRLRRGPRPEGTAAVGAAAFMGVASLVSFTWQTALAGPLAGLLLGMWCNGDGPEDGPPDPSGRLHAAALAGWAACLLAVAGLETAGAIGLPGIPPKGPRLAEEATRRLEDGDAEGAAGLFAEAERDAVSPAVLRNHGAALAASGRWAEAAGVYRRWARCGILHDEALWNESVCLENAGRFSGAAECEEDRLRLYPGRVDDGGLFRLAVLHLRAGNPDAALNVVRRFRRTCGHGDVSRWTAEWDNLAGSALLAAGDVEAARECFGQALRRNPGLESARRNLAALPP